MLDNIKRERREGSSCDQWHPSTCAIRRRKVVAQGEIRAHSCMLATLVMKRTRKWVQTHVAKNITEDSEPSSETSEKQVTGEKRLSMLCIPRKPISKVVKNPMLKKQKFQVSL